MLASEKKKRPPGKLTGLFTDYGEVARLGGWDLGFRQLDPGPQSIRASIVGSGRVTVMNLQFNCGFHQRGCPPAGKVTFGLPVEGMQDWFQRPYKDQSILPFSQASGVDGVSRRSFEAFTISIDEGFLKQISDSYRLPVPDYLLAPQSGAFAPDSQPSQRLRRALRWLIDDDAARLDEAHEASLVVELLNASLAGAGTEDKSRPLARAQAVSKAMSYLEEHRYDAVTVGQVCTAVGSSWRTLERGFLDRFGIGPKAYLQRLRLSGVRDELSVCPADTVIADVANAWGFWHMGQFARDYRRLFGELPSETLRRPR